MDNLNRTAWYRIPGFNGYEFQISSGLVRSMKACKKNPGKILKYNDKCGERIWTLTNDKNERVKVDMSGIISLLHSEPVLVDGSKCRNMSPRRHLQSDGTPQRAKKRIELSDEKNIVPDFSYFFEK